MPRRIFPAICHDRQTRSPQVKLLLHEKALIQTPGNYKHFIT